MEHLLLLIELRLAASRADFPQISLKANYLTMTLPPESNEPFYSRSGEGNSPFQKLMKIIGEGKIKGVRLKQIGKDLTLQIEEVIKGGAKETLAESKRRVEEIHNIWATSDADSERKESGSNSVA